MLKSLVDKKGSSFTIVLTVLCVATVIGIALIDAAVQGLRDNKLQSDMDYAYYAGESAIERCFDIIQTKCTSPTYAAITYDGTNDDFVKQYISKLNSDFTTTGSSFTSSGAITIDVGDTSNAAKTKIKKIESLGASYSEGKATIEIGLQTEVDYMNTGYKMVYAKKKIDVPLPSRYILDTAINTIGDLMVFSSQKGGLNATITGGAVVYGTSPEKKNENNQFYYGGIYARSNAKLKIDGYALSRSFIRVGLYNNSDDSSRIDVTKDAIAKCIQVFGKNDELIVRRNAYTTDDLEMNGENSIIAVNGSYFGLSQGDFKYHDSSSAIVNSAPVHFGYSPESLLSRIVINGDVFINGATVKLGSVEGKSEIEGKGEIEDASILWDNVANKPYYKLYSGEWTDYNYKLCDKYIKTTEEDKKNYSGFLNLFQVNWNNKIDAQADDQKLDNWLQEIKDCREKPEKIISLIPLKIAGFCNSCMAANNRLYVMNKNYENISSISRQKTLTSNWKDQIPGPISGIQGIDTLWDNLYKGDEGFGEWYYYCNRIINNLNALKTDMNDCCQKVVKRYDSFANNSGDTITHEFVTYDEKGSNLFQYLVSKVAGLSIPDEEKKPDDLKHMLWLYGDDHSSSDEIVVSLPEEMGKEKDEKGRDKYYLVVNQDPKRTLVVKYGFKGIIISMGKVVLERGANIIGSIIAAGRGCNEDGSVEGSAADDIKYIPRVRSDGSNRNKLDDGDYAAVLITDVYKPDSGLHGGSDPEITFPGRETLLDRFTDPVIKNLLYEIL